MHNSKFFLTEYKPHTTRLCFFKMPFQQLISLYQKRQEELSSMWEYTFNQIPLSDDLSLQDKIAYLKPYQINSPNRYLFSETQSDWCLYMENGQSGTEVFGQADYLAKVWEAQFISMYLEPDYGKGEYGSVMFHWRNGANIISEFQTEHRTIMVYKETGRVDFEESGSPLSFEDLSNYEKRLKKDRLTIEMVEEYCKYFGLQIFDLDFYKGQSNIFNIK